MTDPVLTSIAAALISKTVTSLYDLVRKKFASDPDATAALESSETTEDTLAGYLRRAEENDQEFSSALRNCWESESSTQYADEGGVANHVSGQVHGNVVQARDIEGGVSF